MLAAYTAAPMKIGIVGLGYVGLPLAVAFGEAGHDVVGVDTDARVIEALAKRPVARGGRARTRRSPAIAERFHATSRYADLAKVDAIIVAVPTPLTRNREPDLQPLIAAGTALAGVLQEGQLVVLESTTYPGTTRDQFVPLLEESGLAARARLLRRLLAGAHRPGPHRLHAAQHAEGRGRPDGRVPRAARSSSTSEVCDEIVEVSTPEAAELTKLLENVFRSVNIALVNELAILCDRMGIDVWEVIDAAATKPYGFMSLQARPRHGRTLPAGRPVLPRLACARVRHADRVHRARRRGQPADAVLLRRADRAGAQRSLQVGPRGADRRSSASPTSRGWATCASRRRCGSCGCCASRAPNSSTTTTSCRSCPSSGCAPSGPRTSDCAVIVTAHPGLDLERVVREAPLVVDFRGVTRGIEASNLVRL